MNIVVQRSTVRITNRKLIQSIRSDPSTFWTANMRGPKFVRALCQQPADDVAPRPERDGRRTVMRWQIVTRRAPRTMAGAGLGWACRAAPSSARQKRQPTPPRRSHGPVSVAAAENGGTAPRSRIVKELSILSFLGGHNSHCETSATPVRFDRNS